MSSIFLGPSFVPRFYVRYRTEDAAWRAYGNVRPQGLQPAKNGYASDSAKAGAHYRARRVCP